MKTAIQQGTTDLFSVYCFAYENALLHILIAESAGSKNHEKFKKLTQQGCLKLLFSLTFG